LEDIWERSWGKSVFLQGPERQRTNTQRNPTDGPTMEKGEKGNSGIVCRVEKTKITIQKEEDREPDREGKEKRRLPEIRNGTIILLKGEKKGKNGMK